MATVLLDSYAQRSYITNDGARLLGLGEVREETVAHSHFGCVETKQEAHRIHDITLQTMFGDIQVHHSYARQIYNHFPSHQTQSFCSALRERIISLTDVQHNVLEVKTLLGADVINRLMTDNSDARGKHGCGVNLV